MPARSDAWSGGPVGPSDESPRAASDPEIDPEHEAGGVFAADAPADALARARAAAKAREADPNLRRAGGARGAARRRRRRPDPVEPSGSGKDGRDPVLLGEQMSRLLARAGWDAHVRSAEVVQSWARVVGPGIATHTTALRHEATVLTVQAHSTPWATQLRLLEPTLLGALSEALGEGVVSRLEVLGPHVPSWSRGRFRVPGRGPRDTYG